MCALSSVITLLSCQPVIVSAVSVAPGPSVQLSNHAATQKKNAHGSSYPSQHVVNIVKGFILTQIVFSPKPSQAFCVTQT